MKVIQVGIGGMGDTWLRTVLDSTEVEHAGFVEINDSIAQEQVGRHNLDPSKIFRSLEEALAAVPTDGVIDVTPPAFHRDVSLIALEAGIPVLSEKPLADTMAAAREIVAKANETGTLHMVAQNYRYTPQAQTIKQVIDSDRLGRLDMVTVEFFKGPRFSGFRTEMSYPLIIDMSIHHFDMMRFFLSREVASIFGRSWNPAWSWFQGDASASILLQFAGDVPISYNGTWCTNGQETPWNGHWRFECEHGTLLLEQDEVYVIRRGKNPERVELVDMNYVAQSYLLHEFYKAVTEGKSVRTACQDNIRSLAIVFDVVRSFERGDIIRRNM